MAFKVLYYPNLSLPSAGWVNSAVLFFDKIGVIGPQTEDPNVLFDERTRALVAAGLVEPIYAGNHYYWSAETDRRFVNALVERHDRQRLLQNPARIRVHVGKLAYSQMVEQLVDAQFCNDPRHSEWLHLPPKIAMELMTYLALQLVASPELQMSLVTERARAWRVLTGQATEQIWVEHRIRAVTELLPVSPSANVHRLLEFREQHWRQLRHFRAYVDGLIRGADRRDGFEGARFEDHLRDAKEAREEVVRRLDAARLTTTGRRIALSAIPVAAAIADHSPWGAAAGLLPFFQQIAHERGIWRGRREAMDSPLAYAALAVKARHTVSNEFELFS